MKIFRKSIVITSIISIVLVSILSIGFVFRIVNTTNILGMIYFSLLTISITGFVSISTLYQLEKKFNVLGLISIILLYSCALVIIFSILTKNWNWDDFNKLSIMAAITLVFFNFAITTALRLGKKLLVLQIITDSSLFMFNILILPTIAFGLGLFENSFLLLLSFGITSFALVLIISILSITLNNTENSNDKSFIKISPEEYNNLKKRIDELEYLQNHRTYSNTDISNDDSWVCVECGTKNQTNFCGNCGAKRPEKKWVCECGTENEVDYCMNCGKRRPE